MTYPVPRCVAELSAARIALIRQWTKSMAEGPVAWLPNTVEVRAAAVEDLETYVELIGMFRDRFSTWREEPTLPNMQRMVIAFSAIDTFYALEAASLAASKLKPKS